MRYQRKAWRVKGSNRKGSHTYISRPYPRRGGHTDLSSPYPREADILISPSPCPGEAAILTFPAPSPAQSSCHLLYKKALWFLPIYDQNPETISERGLIFLFWLKFLKGLDPLLPATSLKLPKRCYQLETNIQSTSLGEGGNLRFQPCKRGLVQRVLLSPVRSPPVTHCPVFHAAMHSRSAA